MGGEIKDGSRAGESYTHFSQDQIGIITKLYKSHPEEPTET